MGGEAGTPLFGWLLSPGGYDVISVTDWDPLLFFSFVHVSACCGLGAYSKHDLPADMLIHSQMVLLFISLSCHTSQYSQSLMLKHALETHSQLFISNFLNTMDEAPLKYLDFFLDYISTLQCDDFENQADD